MRRFMCFTAAVCLGLAVTACSPAEETEEAPVDTTTTTTEVEVESEETTVIEATPSMEMPSTAPAMVIPVDPMVPATGPAATAPVM